MRKYSNIISVTKNSRGVYNLDTSMGCASGMINEVGGCYNECYAAKSAKLYGYDFGETVLRFFKNEKHKRLIVKEINNIKLDFIRIGESGDPSENWDHAIKILKQIDKCNKHIVLVTKHWKSLTDDQLNYFNEVNICINTSISALDDLKLIEHRLREYERIKPYCKSILRIVSCNFNLENEKGAMLNKIQSNLFNHENIIDTVLRVNKRNKLVKNGIININKKSFLCKKAMISMLNKKTYIWKCTTCKEMCGVDITVKNKLYPDKKGIIKQLSLF